MSNKEEKNFCQSNEKELVEPIKFLENLQKTCNICKNKTWVFTDISDLNEECYMVKINNLCDKCNEKYTTWCFKKSNLITKKEEKELLIYNLITLFSFGFAIYTLTTKYYSLSENEICWWLMIVLSLVDSLWFLMRIYKIRQKTRIY